MLVFRKILRTCLMDGPLYISGTRFQSLHILTALGRRSSCTGQKQPAGGFLSKIYSEGMQQVCGGSPMPRSDFNEIAKQLY